MTWELLSKALTTGGAIALGIAFALLFVLWRVESRKAHRRGDAGPFDLTNMTILMQTMRDMLDRQKTLAAEFNKGLDNKVEAIRKVVRAVREEHERLIKTQQELYAIMSAARADLNRIRAHAASGAPERQPRHAPAPPAARTETAAPAHRPAADAERPFSALASPESSGAEPDLIDSWAGTDFGVGEPSPYAFDVPEEAPETPEDPETAREAFRKLLSMSAAGSGHTEASSLAAPTKAAEPDNGRSRSATLRARVLQYRDAGMSVPEIARELGLGKGEVRLILSIGVKEAHHRKQRSSQRDPQTD